MMALSRYPHGQLSRAVAEHIAAAARDAIDRRGVFRIALAGGSTPRATYRCLIDEPIDWSRVVVLFGDERCVPADDPDSNYRMAAAALLDHVPVPASQVHRIRGELGAAEAAEAYEAVVAAGAIDVALLGIGTDGHTASLFPGGAELAERSRLVVATRSPAPPPARVSLSLAALDAAREVVFIVTGASKRQPLADVLAERATDAPALPAAMVCPASDRVHIFADEAASPQPAPGGAKETS